MELFKNLDFLSWELYLSLVPGILLFWLVPSKWRKGILFLFSIFFYLSNGLSALLAVLWIGLTSYIIGRGLLLKKRRLFLLVGLGIVFLPFLLGRVSGMSFLYDHSGRVRTVASLLSCIGMSYTSLMAAGYVIDCYLGRCKVLKLFDYLVFILFFPYAVSGPIERAEHIVVQLEQLGKKRFDMKRLQSGAILILYGLFVKLVLADRMGILVNTVLDDYRNYIGFELILAVVLYGLELYCDFSACSDIARGIARCFGIEIVNNFRQPYFADNIGDFWRRWHISLSTWLRDYIYIPLGGNRKGRIRQSLNLIITFVVSGLWHGFRFHFILWGLLHGIYQIISKYTLNLRIRICNILGIDRKTIGHKIFQVCGTFCMVDFAWLFFRVGELRAVRRIIENTIYGLDISFFTGGYLGLGLDNLEWNVLIIGLLVMFAVDMLHSRYKDNFEAVFLHENLFVKYLCFLGLLAATAVFGIYGKGFESSTFIYRGF